MEFQKIINLLGKKLETVGERVPKFSSKKKIKGHNQWGNTNDRYKKSKQIKFKICMLQSVLCDYSGTYIVVKGTITVTGANNRDRKDRSFVLHLLIAY